MEELSFQPFEHPDSISDIDIEGPVRDQLATTVQWTKICAIAGMSGALLSLLNTLISYNKFSVTGSYMPYITLTGGIVSVIFSFIINYQLLGFSREMAMSLNDDDPSRFLRATSKLKTYFMLIMGLIVVTIVFGTLGLGLMSARFARF